MKSLIVSLCIFALVVSDFTYDGLNRLTKANFDNMLHKKKTVLAMWYTQDCQKCGKEIWDIHYLISSFMESNNFLVAAEVWNGDDELVKKYNIPENHESLELRLFVGSADSPISPSEDDDNWIEWIQANSKLTASPDTSMLLDNSNYNTFTRKAKGKNVFLHAYVPFDNNSQNVLISFMKATKAFKSVKNLLFARVDCYQSRDICSFLKIQQVPEMRLMPNDHTSFDGRSLDIAAGENVDIYLNRYLGTFVDLEGGLNNQYGRDAVLDDLAHQFMNGENEEDYKAVMKKVLKIKKQHPASFRYYKIMKEILTNGVSAIESIRADVEGQLASLGKEGKEYAKVRGMQNVLAQFEKIEIVKGEVFVLTENNFDYVVNGKRNVMVKFYAPWCGHCRALAPIYEELAKDREDDVVIAELNADKYKELARRFNIEGYPTLKWFGKDKDPNMPDMVDSERTKDSLNGYIEYQLTGKGTIIEPTNPEPVDPVDSVTNDEL